MALASNYPQAQGLYDPASEHDACGVAMVATLNKVATHEIVAKALTALRNMEHRGASGAEPDSGDGAGILIRIPDAYFQAEDGIRDFCLSRGLGDVYKRQISCVATLLSVATMATPHASCSEAGS